MIRIWLGCVAALVASSCHKEVDDFRCGAPYDGKAKICDGPNEVCVCATARCAIPVEPGSGECSASQMKYRFPPGDCVEAKDVKTQLMQTTAASLCPQHAGLPPTCGDASDAGACAADEWCLCGAVEGATLSSPARRCVRESPLCAGDGRVGLEYAWGLECIAGPSSREELILRRTRAGACPTLEPDGVHCGVPGAPGNVACHAEAFCLCGASAGVDAGVPRYSCVFPSVRCLRNNELPGLEDRDGRCVSAEPDQLSLLGSGESVCPGAHAEDFLRDGGAPADGGGT